MKTTPTRLLLFLSFLPVFLFSQTPSLKLKLQLLPDGEYWGVYVKPTSNISPSLNTITGSAQATVVMPKNYAWNGLVSVHGAWSADAVVDGPVENPSRSYVSFGLLADVPHITYQAGQETLLFKFKRNSACPDSLYLIENETDPFRQLPNSLNSNPGNEITVFDAGLGLYNYVGNYAPSAWNCHDNDGDGIANALEDTNGNGVFDVGVDASDLNDGVPLTPGCLKIKLQLLPDSSSWGVFAKPFDGYSPSENTVTTGGRVTIVGPADFDYDGFTSPGGDWQQTATLTGPANNPTRRYLSFELQNSPSALDFAAGQETLLFQFDKTGPCPDSLYLMETNIPAVLSPNELSGTDPDNLTISGFELCGVYARKAWRCKPPTNVPPVIIITGGEADSLTAPSPGDVAERGSAIFKNENAEGNWFSASPNPTSGQVQVLLEKDLAEGQATLSLWDLEGKKWREEALMGNSLRLEIGDLPPGLYVLTLKVDGRILQRKKLIKT